MYWTICGTLEVVEPPNLGTGMPSNAAASWKPYWVGTKNGFVVTWFTNQNCHAGVFGKFPATLAAVLLLLPPDEEQAASNADAAAVELTSPVPCSSGGGGAVLHVEGLDCLVDLGVDSVHVQSSGWCPRGRTLPPLAMPG
jgi:hypothetical protein